jgi:hypothetical protein
MDVMYNQYYVYVNIVNILYDLLLLFSYDLQLSYNLLIDYQLINQVMRFIWNIVRLIVLVRLAMILIVRFMC